MNTVKKLWFKLFDKVIYIRYKNNSFIKDIYFFVKQNKFYKSLLYRIWKKYHRHLEVINKDLYNKLNEEDKDIFIRFFLKRFFDVETATLVEIELINKAFKKAQHLYENNNDEYIKIEFRGDSIKYINSDKKSKIGNKENILMDYYDVTHAFFLTEYEKEGFNPQDGCVIFDCGAAHGDTALLFNSLYPKAKIYSFEFGKNQLEDLKKNLLINKVNSVEVIEAFLYSQSGHFYIDDNYNIFDKKMNGYKNINTICIDDFVRDNNISDVDLIKFDIEGGEQSALEGARQTIIQWKPIIYVPIYHLESDIYKIPSFFESLGLDVEFSIKWTEKKVWGVDCVLFAKFI